MLSYIIAGMAGGLVFLAWLKYLNDNQQETLINNLKGFIRHYYEKACKLIRR